MLKLKEVMHGNVENEYAFLFVQNTEEYMAGDQN